MKKSLYFLALVTLILSSCASTRKDIIYFQDIEKMHPEKIMAAYEPVIMKDDKLQIVVSGPDKTVVTPYNFTLSESTVYGNQFIIPYLVDAQGEIEMPGLGRLHVAGMTRTELTDYITSLLRTGGLVKDPVVSVSFLNYRITVLGEVRSPGTYTMGSERVTILQALGTAGDLQITADRKHLLLIRDVDGVQTHIKIDLTSSDILNSPYFYMHQNDVIYVPQSATRVVTGTTSLSTWASALSVLTTLISIGTLVFSLIK